MELLARLAFVDVETNGLSPSDHRIAEVGVITVDGDGIERWSTLVKGGSSARLSHEEWRAAPPFAEIAGDLARRLDGRLVIAHNARFDHAFLKAEFERAGAVFEPKVVCSLMLSRKLTPHLARHDLDSLAVAHGLALDVRHRALPDADLLWQWWQRMREQFLEADLDDAVNDLLAGPVLPAHLDPALVEALPPSPGAYVFHGEQGRALMTGAAANLRAHVADYFRLDRATARALECSHRITDITCRATRGFLGAQLHAAALARVHAVRRTADLPVTWRFAPDELPCVTVAARGDAESYGLFASERKAGNALARLAARRRLCHSLLGLGDAGCLACAAEVPGAGCGGITCRKKQLLRVFSALRSLRVEAWPHRGAIGIRERSDLHVIDRWQFLGTARNEHDVHELKAARRDGFDKRMYRLLLRELPRVPRGRIVDL